MTNIIVLLFLGGWVIVHMISLPPTDYNKKTLDLAFLRFFKKEKNEPRIKVPVPPPPPPPISEISHPTTSPLPTTYEPVLPLQMGPQIKPEAPMRPEPSPWQWF